MTRTRLLLRYIHYGEYLAEWAEIPIVMRPYYNLHRYDGWWWPIFRFNKCSDEKLIAGVRARTVRSDTRP